MFKMEDYDTNPIIIEPEAVPGTVDDIIVVKLLVSVVKLFVILL